MDYALTIVVSAIVLAVILWGIVRQATGGRYADMTEEQFEQEAKRPSLVTADMMALQKMYAPNHRAEYVQEQQERAEADSSESGDGPKPTGASLNPRSSENKS